MTNSATKAREDYSRVVDGYWEDEDEFRAALDAAVLALLAEGIKLGVKWQDANWHRTSHEMAEALLKGEELEKP